MLIQKQDETRLQSVDGLRTVMCIGIALYHFVPYFFARGDAEYAASRYFSYFTDVFAVLAGIFAARYVGGSWTPAYYREFLVKRLARIYPLHIVTLLFYVAVSLLLVIGVMKVDSNSRYDMSAVPAHLSLTHSWGFGPAMAMNYPSWMISAIFAGYLLMPLASNGAKYSKWFLLVLALTSTAICLVISRAYGVDITRSQFIGIGAVRVIPSFLFGLAIGNMPAIAVPKVLTVGIMLSALYLAFSSSVPLQGSDRLIIIYIFITFLVIADKSQLRNPLKTWLLRKLSAYSFGVYLWHGVIATVFFRVAIPKLFHESTLSIGDDNPLYA